MRSARQPDVPVRQAGHAQQISRVGILRRNFEIITHPPHPSGTVESPDLSTLVGCQRLDLLEAPTRRRWMIFKDTVLHRAHATASVANPKRVVRCLIKTGHAVVMPGCEVRRFQQSVSHTVVPYETVVGAHPQVALLRL